MMTLKQFRDQLAEFGEDFGDALVRINGEYLDSSTVRISYPLVEAPAGSGMMRTLGHDKIRPRVVDIAANGRDIPDLPITVIR